MEEIYILEDGTQVDLSKYSDFEKVKFIKANPSAKKKKDTATGASAVSQKKTAPSTGSSLGKSSSGSRSKFRLANDEDFEKQKQTQPNKPTYGVEKKQGNAYEDYYNLKPQTTQPTAKQELVYDEKANREFISNLEKKNTGYLGLKKLKPEEVQNDVNIQNALTSGYLTQDDLVKAGITQSQDPMSSLNVTSQKDINNAIKKVNAFRTKRPDEIETYINVSKLNTPYIYEDYNEGDDFVSTLFDSNELASRNINLNDFNGFLTEKGYKDDIKRMKELELDTDNYGQGYDVSLSLEKRKIQYLNMYINDQIQRDIKRQKLDYEKKTGVDPDFAGIKFKPSKWSANIDLSNYQDLLKKEAPNLTAKMMEVDETNLENYKKLIQSKGNVSAGKFLTDVLSNGWNGLTGAVNDFSASVYGLLPGDYFEGVSESIRENKSIDEMLKGDEFRYVTADGYKTTVNGVQYISNEQGVYDITNKVNVTNILPAQELEKIKDKARAEGVRDKSVSAIGTSYQGANVVGDLIFQLAMTRGTGNGLKAVGGFTEGLGVLGKTKGFLKSVPIKKSIAEATIAQSTLGFSKGYESTLKMAREAGIRDSEAKELASLASIETGAWYAMTAWINPQTKTTDMLFGKSKNEVIENALNAYVKDGKKGFLNSLRGYGKDFLNVSGEGLAEVFQENIQQAGETFVVNKDVNELAGQQLLKDTMSLQDFMDTSVLSFVAGSIIPGAGAGVNQTKKTARQLLGMQGVDRFNSLSTLASNKDKVVNLLSKQVTQGLYTQEQMNDVIGEIEAYSGAINKVPQDISAEAAEEILEDITNLSKLEQKKKSLDKSFHSAIDEEMDVLRNKISRTYYDDITSKRTSTIKKAIQEERVGNMEYREFDSAEDLKSVLINEFNYSEKDASNISSNPGFILTEDNLKTLLPEDKFVPGKKVIFINNDAASSMSQFSVNKHEFLHGIIYETIKEDKEAQVLLGKALAGEILNIQQEISAGNRGGVAAPVAFLKRFNQYINKYSKLIQQQKSRLDAGMINQDEYNNIVDTYLGNQWEEVLTLYSDAIDNGSVVFDEDVFTKIGDMIRRVLQRLGIKNVEFNSGKDVYNFVKDYNRSIEKGTFGGLLGKKSAFEKLSTSKASIDKEALRKEVKMPSEDKKPTKPSTSTAVEKSEKRFSTTEKFSLKDNTPSQDKFKKEINDLYDRDKWGFNYKPDGDRNYVNRVLDEILTKYGITIAQKGRGYGWDVKLPDYSEYDLIAETQTALIPVIRNFNKEFFTLRQEYKQELEKRGLKEGTKEFKEALDQQDAKGYKGKKGVVKENNDLNAYINSLLRFKMYDALKTGYVTSKVFTSNIDDEAFKESSMESFDYYETSEEMLDDIDTLLNEQESFEAEQNKLAVLLKDPIFGFTDEDGNFIEIETVPLGLSFISDINDPIIPANKKLNRTTDPKEIQVLKEQLSKLKRGLELESKEDITPEEKEELKSLKSFKSYNLSTGGMVNTYEAFSSVDIPAKIITEEISREILRVPNIETLEYRNFKDKLSLTAQTMARRMTFKNSDSLNKFMYDNWETIYGVINNPVDPVSGESSYASKKLPPRLKELDENGNFIKRKNMNRALFLQSYFGDEDAKKIIEQYSKNPGSQTKLFEDPEVNEKTGKKLWPTAYFDRRTALMELFGDVLVLQEARRLLRNEAFLESVKDRNQNLYEALKDDITRNAILNNMAKGKSDIVKFSLSFAPNNEVEDIDITTTKRVISEKYVKESVNSISNNPINKLLKPSSIEETVKYSLKDLTSKKLEGYNKKYENNYKEVEGKGKFTSKKSRDNWFEKEKKDYVKVLMLSDLKDQVPGTKLHTLRSFDEVTKEVEKRIDFMVQSMLSTANEETVDLGLDYKPIYLYTGADVNIESLNVDERDLRINEITNIRLEQNYMLNQVVDLITQRDYGQRNIDKKKYKYNIFYTYLFLEDVLSNRYDLDYNNKDIQRKKFKQSDYARTRLPINAPSETFLKESLDTFYDSDTLYPLAAYNLYKIEKEEEFIKEWDKQRMFLPELSNEHKAYKFNQSDRQEDIFSLHVFASRNNKSKWCTGQALSYAENQLSGGDFYIISDKNYNPVIAFRMETNENTGDVKIGEIVGVHEYDSYTQRIKKEETTLLIELYNAIVSKEKDFNKEVNDISLVLNNIDNILKYEDSSDDTFIYDKETFLKQVAKFVATKINLEDSKHIKSKLTSIKFDIKGGNDIGTIADFIDYDDEVEVIVNLDDTIKIDANGMVSGDLIDLLSSFNDIEQDITDSALAFNADAGQFSFRIENTVDLQNRIRGGLSLDNIVTTTGLINVTFSGFNSYEFNNLEEGGMSQFYANVNGLDPVLTVKENAEFEIVDFNLIVDKSDLILQYSKNEELYIELSQNKVLASMANITIKEEVVPTVVLAENVDTTEIRLNGNFEVFLNENVEEIVLSDSSQSKINLLNDLNKLKIYLFEEDADNLSIDNIEVLFPKEKRGKNLYIETINKLILDNTFLTEIANSKLTEGFDNVYVNSVYSEEKRIEIVLKEGGKLKNDSSSNADNIKFSLAEENNAKYSVYMENFGIKDQFEIARILDDAVFKARTISKNPKTFKVPNLEGMNDKAISFYLIDKVSKGYNDFEFLNKDNSKGNLTNDVLNVSDIKFSIANENAEENDNLDAEFSGFIESRYNSNPEIGLNEIIEENKKIPSTQKFSPETAKNRGKNIGRHDIWLPPQDEDFSGLLYRLASAKGKVGEAQKDFFDKHLINPYSDAMLNLMHARQAMYRDWTNLINKKYKGISKRLKKDSGYEGYTLDQAVRVFIWDYNGFEIPGLDAKDQRTLRDIVRKDKELRAFASDISILSKQANGYIEPDHNWGFGTVVGDINNVISKSNRDKFLEQWQHNIDKIFSKDNLSKIEAVYGRVYVSALKNMLQRMKTGSNRAEGSNDEFMNWLNGATGVTMFFNMRSALLQTISASNFINTTDNNVVKIGMRMVDLPQFSKDFSELWNSDYLKDRRSGLMNDVAEAELAQVMNDPRNKNVLDKFKAANYWILKQGFLPTRMADSFAIAFGGASFYRNRINTYKKQGLSEEDAKKKAMRDFYETSEVSQQSADVSRISQNQASVKGRLIFAFQNTPLQYSRIIKKSVIDIAKGRGSLINNAAKILYYSTIQNVFFNFMQNALFRVLWDDDDEQKEAGLTKDKVRAANGVLDTLLRGSGMKGVIISTVKNIVAKWYEKHGDQSAGGEVLVEALNISPPIGIKARKLMQSYKTVEWNIDEIKEKGFSIENKYALEATSTITSGVFNIPVDRLYVKTNNVADALNSEYGTWDRIFFALGYNKYNLDVEEDEDSGTGVVSRKIIKQSLDKQKLSRKKLVR
jgi:hypothetical protein